MPHPPKTRREEIVETIFGREVRDPYRWLEDPAAPEVRDWVAAQQAFARAHLDRLPGRPAIERRLRESADIGSLGIHLPRGRYRFATRREPGRQQPALYVIDPDGGERLLVDPAPESPDGATAIDWWYPSGDGELVAYGISEGGGEESVLHLLETASGRVLPDRIDRCRGATVAFEPGNRALLYSRQPKPGTVPAGEEAYHRHVHRHVLGTDPESDTDLLGEGRPMTDFPGLLSVASSGRWATCVMSQGWTRTAVFLRHGEGRFEAFFEGIEALVQPWFDGDRLLAVTNHEAPRWRLVEIDPEHPDPRSWRTLVPESEHVLLQAATAGGRLLVHHLARAASRVSVHAAGGALERVLEVPPFSTVTAIGADPERPDAYLTLQGYTRPPAVLELDAGSGRARTRVVEALAPPPGFDGDRHPTRQVTYTSKDGTEVTMFLVGRTDGAGPTLLTGYGGYNINRTPLWSPNFVPFLEAGGLIAEPNLRGGGEYGEDWHRAGMLGRKQNVFDDFFAAAESLVEHGHCRPAQLGIMGGSNGGLLVGVALTQRPELFGAVVCRVPLLDMVRYERFKIARLWAAEYGSAEDPEGFGWLYAYSPYHHVREGLPYPPTLITTGEEDSRVEPMHARKMAALLQAANPKALTLLRVDRRAGHGQGKPVGKMVQEEADIWAFLLDHLLDR